VKRRDDEDADARHPRNTFALTGHGDAEQAMLDAYQGGRMPHAWLIGGPSGIGKATLAYRLARFVLAHPDARAIASARSLAIDANHPTARRIASQAHPDLLILQRTENEKGVLRTVIRVDDVRRTIGFFGSTAGEGGWRVCIVDRADELQYPQAANALLKVIEEPPPRSLFLLVSDAPGRLLPTIRSRCRRIDLRPLSTDEVVHTSAAMTERAPDDPDLAAAAAASDGSVGRAFDLLEGDRLALLQKINALLARLPEVDPRALHALGDDLAGTDAGDLATFVDAVSDWLSARLRAPAVGLPRLARVAEVWEKIAASARDVEIYNLERKPLVFSVFGLLAETARE
jgi:DNA polymerase-3 subunit delta'